MGFDTMHDFHRLLLSSEVRDLTDEVARLFDDLERQSAGVRRAPMGHCTPALDVLETETDVEIVVDLPGTSPEDIRVLLKNGVLLVVGEKRSPYHPGAQESSFHLVERGFGRFARAIRLQGAFDGGRTRALAANGELRIIVPKITDRRGQEIRVPVTAA
jgi:HSP20 family protein